MPARDIFGEHRQLRAYMNVKPKSKTEQSEVTWANECVISPCRANPKYVPFAGSIQIYSIPDEAINEVTFIYFSLFFIIKRW
jgi:hypothetical protein